MARFRAVSAPSIISSAVATGLAAVTNGRAPSPRQRPTRLTITGAIGAICMFPLRAIIRACVALRIHPNTLTLVGVLINVGAAWALGFGHFRLAFVIMLVANIFDFIDGKVAHITQRESQFGAFWDSTLDRFSDLALAT